MTRAYSERLELLKGVIPLVRATALKVPQLCGYTLDDLIQDGLIHVWRLTETYDDTKGAKFSSYVTQILGVRMHNFYQRAHNKPWLDMAMIMPSEAQLRQEPNAFSRVELKQLLSVKGGRYADVLSMRAQGYNDREIGDSLGVSYQAIGQKIKRALRAS